jgi:hypothetical protein
VKRAVVAAVLAALLGAFLLWWLSPSQVIQRRIHNLFETASFSTPQGVVSSSQRAATLDALLAAEVTLATPVPRANRTYRRGELVDSFRLLLQQASSFQLDDLTIDSLTVSGPTAEARISFSAQLVIPPRERPLNGPYSASISFIKAGSTWQLAAIRIDR